MSYGALMAQIGLRLATLFIRSSLPPAPLRSHHQRRDRHFGGDESRKRRAVRPCDRGPPRRRSVRPSALRCSPRGASNPNIHERNARYTMTKPSGSAVAMTPASCIVLLRPLKKCGWTERRRFLHLHHPPATEMFFLRPRFVVPHWMRVYGARCVRSR